MESRAYRPGRLPDGQHRRCMGGMECCRRGNDEGSCKKMQGVGGHLPQAEATRLRGWRRGMREIDPAWRGIEPNEKGRFSAGGERNGLLGAIPGTLVYLPKMGR